MFIQIIGNYISLLKLNNNNNLKISYIENNINNIKFYRMLLYRSNFIQFSLKFRIFDEVQCAVVYKSSQRVPKNYYSPYTHNSIIHLNFYIFLLVL